MNPNLGRDLPLFPLEQLYLFQLYNLVSNMSLFDDNVPILKVQCKNLDAMITCFTKVFLQHVK